MLLTLSAEHGVRIMGGYWLLARRLVGCLLSGLVQWFRRVDVVALISESSPSHDRR